jgi:hypothetical protein
MRQEAVDFVQTWSKKTPLTQAQILVRLGLSSGKYHDWVQRYELENAHNARLPKEFWLQKAEKKAILSYHAQHPDEGYRRLAYMMLDENVAAVSPSNRLESCKNGQKSPRKKEKASNSPKKPMSIGTLTFLISISLEPFTTFAPCWMGIAATSSIGRFENR